jgi:dethiobiotin synthetase
MAAENLGEASWIIEGAGGVLVPINDSEHMVDLARMLSLPVVVVISTKLGTINHTLLTLEALRKRALIVTGVVMVGDKDTQVRETIEAYGLVQVLGEMPTFPDLSRDTLSRWARRELDEQGVLLHHLRLAHRANP